MEAFALAHPYLTCFVVAVLSWVFVATVSIALTAVGEIFRARGAK